MNQKFPHGWNKERVCHILDYYEHQSEEEAVAEDEAAYEQEGQSMIEIPYELVTDVRNLIVQYQAMKAA
ncbi:MAG: hypothetical protein ABH870_08750 [bacterium]